MRTFLIAATAAMALGAAVPAHAFTVPAGGGLSGVADAVGIVDDAQVMVYGGRQYCFYLDAWNGPGWYRCGFAWRRGIGFGGYYGWNRWYLPRYHARFYNGRGWNHRRNVHQGRQHFRQHQRQQRRDVRQGRQQLRQDRRGNRQQFRQERRGDRQQFRQDRREQMQGQRGGGDRGGMRGGGGNRGSMSGGGGGRGGMGGGGGGMGGGGGGGRGGGGGMGGGGGGGMGGGR